MKCPCNTECTDCFPGFQKIIDLKNVGLIIYRHKTETNDVNKKTGNLETAINTTEDIYILHNTKHTDISSADYWPEIEQKTVSCPRCKKILENAQKILKNGPNMTANFVTGICDKCKMRDKPCSECRQVLKTFVLGNPDRTDINKERVRHWLTKIGNMLQDVIKITEKKKRSHSDSNIDQICLDPQRSVQKPNVEQLFEPLELDLAVISQPNIERQKKGQNNVKKLVAHFPQLEKLETPIVFKDPLRRLPSASEVDEIFNTKGYLNAQKKEVPSKCIAPPVGINTRETIGMKESVIGFEQIFKGTVTQSDDIIGFMPTETKHNQKNLISEQIEKKFFRQRTKSVQPTEKKLVDSKIIEPEHTSLIRKYNSTETLVIKTHDITESNLKQANRIIFPRPQLNKLTKQKSSSELINDTKKKLIRAEEDKTHNKILNEQASRRSDEKLTARKKIESDYQETAVDDNQKAGHLKDSQTAQKGVSETGKGDQEDTIDASITKMNGYVSEKGAKKSTDVALKAEEPSYKTEKGVQIGPKKALTAVKGTFEKGTQKDSKEAKKAETEIYKSEKSAKKLTKDAQVAGKFVHKYEMSAQKSPKEALKADKDGYTFEKGVKKSIKDATFAGDAEKGSHKIFKEGAKKTPKDAQKDVSTSDKGGIKTLKDTQKAEKSEYMFEKVAKKSTKDNKIAETNGSTSDKGAKKSIKDGASFIAKKDAHKFKEGAQKTPIVDVQKAKKEGLISEKDAQNAERDTYEKGIKKSKVVQIPEKDANKFEEGAQKTPKHAQKTDAQNTEKDTYEKGTKKSKGIQIPEKTPKTEADKIALKSIKVSTALEKNPIFALPDQKSVSRKFPRDAQKDMIQKSQKKIQKLQKGDSQKDLTQKSTKSFQKIQKEDSSKITMEPKDPVFEKLKNAKVSQRDHTSSTKIKKNKDREPKLKTEKQKGDTTKKQSENQIPKIDPRLAVKPISHDLVDMKSIQIKRSSLFPDDLIVKLVQQKPSNIRIGTKDRMLWIEPIFKRRLSPHRYGSQSETCLLWTTDDSEIDDIKPELESTEIIIGPNIYKKTAPKIQDDSVMPILLQSGNSSAKNKKQVSAKSPKTDESIKPSLREKQEKAQTPETPKSKESIKLPVNQKQETGVSTQTPRTKTTVKPNPLQSPAAGAAKGYVRYTLSDRKFIDNGWTLLPTEKVVRKMNVYRMRPARPEFDWFEHNKNKRLMQYDTGEKFAEFDDNGRGRWFYRNGRMALDYYDAEELNAGQRFVIYSNGEPDERGRSRPYTLLATFDFSGNGIVFDHRGKIRLKYNQTEGVLLDRSIGPVSHWKWHTLNDPPVLQQVMIDTQMAHKDPKIMKMGGPNDQKPRKDNEEMLAIEFDNFVKEKSKKLSQTFKPFQIKMKALKINEHFSLRVLDQATVYLLYRDGTTSLKLNIGMVLDQKEIVDTDTAEVGEVSSSMEKLPARTESLAGLQRSVAHAQRYDRKRTERERKLHPAEPNASVDKLVAGISHPLRPLPQRPMLSQSTSLTATDLCKCSRKPSSTNVYYDTRFY